MKQKIHPKYNEECVVTCACGNNFKTGSTLEAINIELCNMCHPFYTGKQKFVDTARRVEKFQARAEKSAAEAATRKGKKVKNAAKAAKKSDADKEKADKSVASKAKTAKAK